MPDYRGMFTYPAKWLTGLGLALLALALALVMYDPHTGAVGYYPKAITGGAIGAGFGLAALVCGQLAKSGKRMALWVGLLVCLLALAGFFMRAKTFVKRARGAEPELIYPAIVISLMSFASFLALINVSRGIRRLPPPSERR